MKWLATLLFALLLLSPPLPAAEKKPAPPAGEDVDIHTITPDELVGAGVRTLITEAHTAYHEKRYEDAARAFIRALRRNPGDSSSLYNLACCYGLLGMEKQASRFLEAAYDGGFRDLGHIRGDPDFDPVRKSEPFQAALERLSRRSEEDRAARGELLMLPARLLTPVRVVLPEGREPGRRVPLVVGLHGYGDSAESFAGLFRRRGIEAPFLFVVPEAPYPLLAGSRVGYSWTCRDPDSGVPDGLLSRELAETYVLEVIRTVKRHYPVDERKVFLLGFSQGAGMTYSVGMDHAERFRGIIPIGGYCDPGEHPAASVASAAKHGNFLVCHSRTDRMVPFEEAEKALRFLQRSGIRHRLVEYEGGHSVPRELIAKIARWIEGLCR